MDPEENSLIESTKPAGQWGRFRLSREPSVLVGRK